MTGNYVKCQPSLETSNLLIFMNPDKRLCVALVLTFALENLDIFEERYPDKKQIRRAIELTCQVLLGEDVSVKDLSSAANDCADIADLIRVLADDDIVNVPILVSNAATAAYTRRPFLPLSCVTWNAKLNEISFEFMIRLLPLIIDYAIDNQIKLFTAKRGGFTLEYICDLQSPEYKEKIFYNLDLFTPE